MKKFIINIIVDFEAYMAGTIEIPDEILNDKKAFLEYLENSNYIVFGYAEEAEEKINVIFSENYFVVCENGITFLEGYLV